MSHLDLLDEIIERVDPEDVPAEFIMMAQVVDQQGVEHILRGPEMLDFLANPERDRYVEARVALDLRRIRLAVLASVNLFFSDLDRRIADLDAI